VCRGIGGEEWTYKYIIASRSWESTSMRICEDTGENVIDVLI
jgi:hypothetical protein